MATAHVSGVAALLKSYKRNITAAELFNALTSTALDKGKVGRDNGYGYGIVDALAAIQYLELKSSTRDCVNVTLTLTTDDSAWETFFALTDLSNGELIWNVVGGDLQKNHSYVYKSCVDPSYCYYFEIEDSSRNGTNGKGIALTYNGNTLYHGDFGNFRWQKFGDGC